MATWHQKRNPIPLWHECYWTIVSDPPNEMCCLRRELTREDAEHRLAVWKANGSGQHCYILPPGKVPAVEQGKQKKQINMPGTAIGWAEHRAVLAHTRQYILLDRRHMGTSDISPMFDPESSYPYVLYTLSPLRHCGEWRACACMQPLLRRMKLDAPNGGFTKEQCYGR